MALIKSFLYTNLRASHSSHQGLPGNLSTGSYQQGKNSWRNSPLFSLPNSHQKILNPSKATNSFILIIIIKIQNSYLTHRNSTLIQIPLAFQVSDIRLPRKRIHGDYPFCFHLRLANYSTTFKESKIEIAVKLIVLNTFDLIPLLIPTTILMR